MVLLYCPKVFDLIDHILNVRENLVERPRLAVSIITQSVALVGVTPRERVNLLGVYRCRQPNSKTSGIDENRGEWIRPAVVADFPLDALVHPRVNDLVEPTLSFSVYDFRTDLRHYASSAINASILALAIADSTTTLT